MKAMNVKNMGILGTKHDKASGTTNMDSFNRNSVLSPMSMGVMDLSEIQTFGTKDMGQQFMMKTNIFDLKALRLNQQHGYLPRNSQVYSSLPSAEVAFRTIN